MRPHRSARRSWRRRGRRAQVAAVATVLGLLLVVTMVANYLTTQLPGQMRVNDANHVLVVENQVTRLAASLRAAAEAGEVGAVLTQPVSLGSIGAPPFAPADGAVIGPGAKGAELVDSFKVTGGGSTLSQSSSGSGGASFVVNLRNTYTPQVVIAFDQGAVVYAQPNGLPAMLVGPSLTYAKGAVRLWVPVFFGSVGTEAGVGTAELSARLVSLLNLSLPSDGFTLSGVMSIAVTTPFAAAWMSYLTGPASSFAGDAVCVPATSSACAGPFAFNGPLGTVYVNVTATALTLQVATYAVSLG